MKTFLFPLLGAAAALAAAATSSSANDRYADRPPVMVSPDLSAPWVLQLGRAPGIVRQNRQEMQNPQRRSQRQAQPAQLHTAAVQAPSKKRMVARPQIDPIYLPQEVAYDGPHKPGTIVIDTTENFLYLVENNGKARRYGVGTGKPGFEWAGKHKISQKKVWPEWRPPAEMITREAAKGRYLPTYVAGGAENPLGARALYLGSTLYRIHGTNQPWTIGGAVSSGCIRMRNEDVVDLYERVNVGTTVVVI
ncbi:MAG: L,D-transpeptidase [Mesorhizobium sp.]|uniref:L,D-transpeptidase n=1 Tax=Mesorhizobium sp. TaxID=1871066 RepID=UPI000FE63E6B|nr:L,D-transpeptidase [Mesorhizobium sp.]RWO97822.1 MAG: L,D-transpeptidase [Mesorhizobium sp.]